MSRMAKLTKMAEMGRLAKTGRILKLTEKPERKRMTKWRK